MMTVTIVRRVALAGLVAAVLSAVAATPQAQAPRQAAGVPTFTKDVAPIFYDNCVSCHRPGESGPMSLLTFEAARPFARSIANRVGNGSMPPWHAEAPIGTFHNERRLTPEEKDTIVRWASNGAPQGDPRDLPAMPTFAEGWSIGTPDVVLSMSKPFDVPATGTIDYQNIPIPTNFTEDKWVQALELRAGAPSVVHHILVFAMDPEKAPRPDPFRQVALPNGGNHGVEMPARPAAPPAAAQAARPAQAAQQPPRPQAQPTLIASLAPGENSLVFQPGNALLIKKGTVLNFQLHYTASGQPTADLSKIGFIFAKEAPRQEVRSSQFFNPQLILPAGAGNQRVDAMIEFTADAHITAMIPHTHLRGKTWEYRMTYPDGREEVVLAVPRYDFNWQTYYEFKTPIAAPKGARLLAIAHYDNSAANKSNPDPTKVVRWGEQTWEEMQYTGITYTLDQPAATITSGQQ
jgi:hypothetical protein